MHGRVPEVLQMTALPRPASPFDEAALDVSNALRRAETLTAEGHPNLARLAVEVAVLRLHRLALDSGLVFQRRGGRRPGNAGRCGNPGCGGYGHNRRTCTGGSEHA